MAGYSKKRQFVQRRRILRTFSGLGVMGDCPNNPPSALDPTIKLGSSGLTVADLQAKCWTDAEIEAVIAGIVGGSPGNVVPGDAAQQIIHTLVAPSNPGTQTAGGSSFSQWLNRSDIPGVKNSYLLAGGVGLLALAAIAGGGRRR